jgi:hypothetical protein
MLKPHPLAKLRSVSDAIPIDLPFLPSALHDMGCQGPSSCPVPVDGFKRSGWPLFDVSRAYVAKIPMAAFSIVEHLDLFEQIGACLLSCSVADGVHTFAFEDPEKLSTTALS